MDNTEILSSDLENYLSSLAGKEHPLLDELERETYLKILNPRMISGRYQGRFLAMISRLLQPEHILEIGSFTGYSALCLAEGLQEKGKLISYEIDPELEDMIRRYIEKAAYQDRIELRIADALPELASLPDEYFDLVFLDADKKRYPQYYEALLPKLKSGGCLLADNVLWYAKVWQEQYKDKDTEALRLFNQTVASDQRVDALILPLRDGISFIRKK